MEFRPIKKIRNEIQQPIQAIAIVAVSALILAAIALFVSLGKES